MTLHVLKDLEQGSEEWHAARRGIVTASVVGRLITTRYPGADSYPCFECLAEPSEPCVSKVKRGGITGAPIKTFHSIRTTEAQSHREDRHLLVEPAHDDDSRALTMFLAAERITGHTEDTYISNDMWRGIEDEPFARDLYSQHYAPVHEVGLMIREDQPTGYKIGFSPDGLVGDDGAIEIKSRRQKGQLATILADTVPAENMAQLQCGLLVSGREWIDYVSYSGGMPLYVKRVFPSPRWFEAIVAAVGQFEQDATDIITRYERAAALCRVRTTERRIEVEMSL